jgi:hypothetical protein
LRYGFSHFLIVGGNAMQLILAPVPLANIDCLSSLFAGHHDDEQTNSQKDCLDEGRSGAASAMGKQS